VTNKKAIVLVKMLLFCLSQNPGVAKQITELEISGGDLTEIDIPDLPNIKTLSLYANKLSHVQCPRSVSNLYLFDNLIKYLDLSGLELDDLDIGNNPIEFASRPESLNNLVVSKSLISEKFQLVVDDCIADGVNVEVLDDDSSAVLSDYLSSDADYSEPAYKKLRLS